MKNEHDLIDIIRGKKILYIASKNRDYIRISQEIDLLQKYAERCDVISFTDKKYVKRMVKITFELLKKNVKRYDVVYVSFMPQMIIPIFSWKWKNKTVITDFFISVYDTLVDDRKKFTQNSFGAKVAKWIDQCTVDKSDYIVADTKAHGQYFAQEFNIKENDIYVMYLKAETLLYHPMNCEREAELKHKYVVLYFGSILPVQGVDVVLESVKLLKNKDDIYFILIGPIKSDNKVNTGNVTYIDWLSQEELAKQIAVADLCLAGHFSGTVGKAKRTIPGKVYIYKAMEKRVILGDSPANRELFSDMTDTFVPLGDAQALADCIYKLAEEHKKNGEKYGHIEICENLDNCADL